MVRRPKSALLGTGFKRALYGVTALLWLTGVFWWLLSEGHPQRPLWMQIHGAAAMAFLLFLGALLYDHVPTGWSLNTQRPSGGVVLGACGVLVLTGWGLYYFGNDSLRRFISEIHCVLGILLPVVIFLHIRSRNPL